MDSRKIELHLGSLKRDGRRPLGLVLAIALVVDLSADQQRCLELTFLPLPRSPVVVRELTRATQRRDVLAGPTVWPSAAFLPPGTELKKNRQVGVRFTVLPIGRASNCEVVTSSGNATIDSRSCALTLRHLRTMPAMANGTPVASEGHLSFYWQPKDDQSTLARCQADGGTLPIEPLAWVPSGEVPGALRLKKNANTLIRLKFGGGGRAETCEVVATTAPAPMANELCGIAVRNAVVLPAVNERGDTVPATVTRLVRTRVKPDFATLPLVTD